jgi:hypothetical protein
MTENGPPFFDIAHVMISRKTTFGCAHELDVYERYFFRSSRRDASFRDPRWVFRPWDPRRAPENGPAMLPGVARLKD